MNLLRIASGPDAPGFGSWECIGLDLCWALGCHTTRIRDAIPDCDVAVLVKFKPAADVLALRLRRCRLVYCPVDVYGSAAEIDADAAALQCFDRILVHCERLRKYFSAYAPVDYLEHHLKFITDPPQARTTNGPILWIGNRSNLPPVVEWVIVIDCRMNDTLRKRLFPVQKKRPWLYFLIDIW